MLGIGRDAVQTDVREAYKERSRETHPDKGGTKEAFQTVGEAYRVLSDANLRQHYDEVELEPEPEAAAAEETGYPVGPVTLEDVERWAPMLASWLRGRWCEQLLSRTADGQDESVIIGECHLVEVLDFKGKAYSPPVALPAVTINLQTAGAVQCPFAQVVHGRREGHLQLVYSPYSGKGSKYCSLTLRCTKNAIPCRGTSCCQLEELLRDASTAHLSEHLAVLGDGSGFVYDPDNRSPGGAQVVSLKEKPRIIAMLGAQSFAPESNGLRPVLPKSLRRISIAARISWFLEHVDRRQYDGTVFFPAWPPYAGVPVGRVPGENDYNTYRGRAIELDDARDHCGGLDPGRCLDPGTGLLNADGMRAMESGPLRAWTTHLRVVWCRGDDALYAWVLSFFAHILQKPWEKPKVALVLRSAKAASSNPSG